jgi:hypothetical protein
MARSQTIPSHHLQHNPALEDLSMLLGEWEVELWGASFLPNPEDRVHGGNVQFEWIEDGALIAMRQSGKLDTPPAARWVIGRDQSSDHYSVFYSDSRGVSRIYAMSFNGRKWQIWRDNDEFAQRFEAVLSEDSRTMSGRWEKSSNGGDWEHDFNVEYTRRG